MWTSISCPSLCTNVVTHGSVSLFSCDQPSLFQCGTGRGPGHFTVNFTIPNQNIILRNDQEPGAPNAVNFYDPSATFVSQVSSSSTAAASTTAAPDTIESTTASVDTSGPSVTAVGLGIGLPLGFLLLVSLGIIIWQERRIQHSKKCPKKVDEVDLLRATKAAKSSEQVARPAPSTWRGGDILSSRWGPTPPNANLQIPARSGRQNGSGNRNDEVHELCSPTGMEPRSVV